VFNFFKSKKPQHKKYDFNLLEVKNEVFKFFEKKFPEDLEFARTEFVRLTGPFDEEHEYFESKLDDFRNWFLFFYGRKKFKKLESVKDFPEVSKYYEYLTSGNFSIFYVSSVNKDLIYLKDLFIGKNYVVKDAVSALSLSKNDIIQTSLYYKGKNIFEFGLSLIVHPPDSFSYIKKKIKEIDASGKEEFFEKLMSMRYQFFKYKQLKVKQIYSDSSLFEKDS
jgi:hypothetical protein